MPNFYYIKLSVVTYGENGLLWFNNQQQNYRFQNLALSGFSSIIDECKPLRFSPQMIYKQRTPICIIIKNTKLRPVFVIVFATEWKKGLDCSMDKNKGLKLSIFKQAGLEWLNHTLYCVKFSWCQNQSVSFAFYNYLSTRFYTSNQRSSLASTNSGFIVLNSMWSIRTLPYSFNGILKSGGVHPTELICTENC